MALIYYPGTGDFDDYGPPRIPVVCAGLVNDRDDGATGRRRRSGRPTQIPPTAIAAMPKRVDRFGGKAELLKEATGSVAHMHCDAVIRLSPSRVDCGLVERAEHMHPWYLSPICCLRRSMAKHHSRRTRSTLQLEFRRPFCADMR
jgi:hypothetical protein